MAKSPEEAIGCKTPSAIFLAGGTEVNRLGSDAAAEADILISLKKCSGLRQIEAAGGKVRIGSMCTFQQMIDSDEIPGYLKEAAHFMASRTKRNMATIGGNIAAMRSDSYLIPVLYAVRAQLSVLTQDGEKEIRIDSYIDGAEAADDMLITAVTVPADANAVSKRYSNTAQSHAVLTMSAAVTDEGFCMAGAVKNAGILHFSDLERAFLDDPDISEEAIIRMVRDCKGLETADDMFGSDAYKRYLIAVTAFDLRGKLAGKEV